MVFFVSEQTKMPVFLLIVFEILATATGIYPKLRLYEIEKVAQFFAKGHSLYQISSKMLPGSKVITLVEKKRKEVAWLGLELTTSRSEVQCANHYTMETFMMNLYFLSGMI